MITRVLHCPYCQSTDIVRHGTTSEGKQRYRCRACRRGRGRTFLLAYTYAGLSSEVKQQVMYLAAAGKYLRLLCRPLEGQKGMDERTVMAAQRPSGPG